MSKQNLLKATFVTEPPMYVGRPEGGSLGSIQPDLYGDSPSLPSRPYILLVEDNNADVFLIQAAIRKFVPAATVEVLSDGQEAILFFDRADADASIRCPDVVVLDLNLPKAEGRNVLAYLRKLGRGRVIPVIIASSSNSTTDREVLLGLGADAYFHKPSDYDTFLTLGQVIRSLLPGEASSPGKV